MKVLVVFICDNAACGDPYDVFMYEVDITTDEQLTALEEEINDILDEHPQMEYIDVISMAAVKQNIPVKRVFNSLDADNQTPVNACAKSYTIFLE